MRRADRGRIAQDRRVTLGIRLLADLRTIFGNAEALHTRTVLERLADGERWGLDSDAPWGDLHGKPLAERGLATMLKKYDVHSMKVKVAGDSLQGYRREHLWDAWQRYLPPLPKQAEPVEPAEPGPGKVPEVPEVPAAMESVRCRDCAYFDPDESFCLKFDQATSPDQVRACSAFAPPCTPGGAEQ
jgi:hypothetical protein